MIYDIEINQRAIIENNLDLDIIEAFILTGMSKLAQLNWITKIVIHNKVYCWFKHEFLKEQLPMLKMTPDRLYRILKGLEAKGFIEAHPNNKQLKQSFYALGSITDILISDTKNNIGKNTDVTVKTPNKQQEHRSNIGENTEVTSVKTPMEYNKEDNSIKKEETNTNTPASENEIFDQNPAEENFNRLKLEEEERKKVAEKKESDIPEENILRATFLPKHDINLSQLTYPVNMPTLCPRLIDRIKEWITCIKGKKPSFAQVSAQAFITACEQQAQKYVFDKQGDLAKGYLYVEYCTLKALTGDFADVYFDNGMRKKFKEYESTESEPSTGNNQQQSKGGKFDTLQRANELITANLEHKLSSGEGFGNSIG